MNSFYASALVSLSLILVSVERDSNIYVLSSGYYKGSGRCDWRMSLFGVVPAHSWLLGSGNLENSKVLQHFRQMLLGIGFHRREFLSWKDSC